MPKTAERLAAAQDSDAIALSMEFTFDPTLRRLRRRGGGLNVSISERVVDFARRAHASSSQADVEELATQITQLTGMASQPSGRYKPLELEKLVAQLNLRAAKARTSLRVEALEELVSDIRRLRKLSELPPKRGPEPSSVDAAQLLTALDGLLTLVSKPRAPLPTLRRCSFGSPFELTMIVGASGAGLRLLFYGAKRLFGFDLEVRAYRADLRKQLEEARIDAEVLELANSTADERRELNKQLDDPNLQIGPWRGQSGSAVGLDEELDDREQDDPY